MKIRRRKKLTDGFILLLLGLSAAGNLVMVNQMQAVVNQKLYDRNCWMWANYDWKAEVAARIGVEPPAKPPQPRPTDDELNAYCTANQ